MQNYSGNGKANPVDVLRRPFFFWSLPFIFLYFGLPIISKEFGANAVEIGGLFSVFTAATLLLRPLIGWSVDRFGRKLFFVTALVIYALAMGLFAAADSMTWLYAARLTQGIGSAFLWTAANTLVADLTVVGERGKALGQINQITSQGGMIGVMAASLLLFILPDSLGWRYSFIAFTLLTLFSAWLAWKTIPDPRPVRLEQRPKWVLSAPLAKLLVVVFITGIPEAMLAPIYLTYLQDKFTTDAGTLAWAFFPAGLVAAFFSTRLGSLSDRFGRAPMLAAGLLGSGVISLFMPGLPSLIWLAVLYTLTTILLTIAEPAEIAMVADLVGSDRRGAGYGVYDFIENLGLTIGPVLGGLLYDSLGKAVPFYLNGVILIFSAFWVYGLLRKDSPPVISAE